MTVSRWTPQPARDSYSRAVRIVSLLPSTTEILFAIGAGDDVVGVTFECDEPSHARSTRAVVSTTTLPHGLTPGEIDSAVRQRLAAGEDLYTLDADALRALAPDVVITQDLCAVCAVDVKEVDEALEYLGCTATVVTVDPSTLEEVLASIGQLGHVTGRHREADLLVDRLRTRLDDVKRRAAGKPRPRVTVLEWTDPPFSAGHWIPDMIEVAGGTAGLATPGHRSSAVTWDEVSASDPEVIVVAPCGYRLSGATALANELVSEGRLPPGVPVWAVDADAAFVRPGPRLVDGVEVLSTILHPNVSGLRKDEAARIN